MMALSTAGFAAAADPGESSCKVIAACKGDVMNRQIVMNQITFHRCSVGLLECCSDALFCAVRCGLVRLGALLLRHRIPAGRGEGKGDKGRRKQRRTMKNRCFVEFKEQ